MRHCSNGSFPIRLGLVLFLLSFFSIFAFAESDGFKPFIAAEIYSGHGADKYYRESVDQARSSGIDASINSGNGYGGHIGIMFSPAASPLLSWGASVDYIVGPLMKAQFPNFEFGHSFDSTIKTDYIRVLAEGAGRFPIAKNLSFKLGLGLGVARASLREDDMYHVNFNVGPFGTVDFADTVSNFNFTTGLTWEIGPGLVYDFSKSSIEFGLRYVSLPTIGESPTTSKVAWNPWGMFLSYDFK